MATNQGLWISLSVATLIQSCVGVGSCFGVWSECLKQKFGYSQSELTTIASFKDLGVSLGVVAGLFADVYPPWAVLMAGAILNFLGYSCIWLSLKGLIPVSSFFQFCAYALVGSHGSNWLNCAGMVTMVKNYPHHSGLSIGYLKGFIGLSAAMFVQIYWATVAPNLDDFVLLIAILPSAVALVVMPFLRAQKPDSPLTEPGSEFRFVLLGMASAFLAVYLFICSSIREEFGVTRLQNISMVAGMIAMLSFPFILVAWNYVKSSNSGAYAQLAEDPQVPVEFTASVQVEREDMSLGEPHSLSQAVTRLEFWLMFVCMLLGGGSALAVADNLGQITAALGHTPSLALSLYSVMSFFGFLLGGFTSEYVKKRLQWPRTVFGLFMFPFLALSLLCLASGTDVTLHGSIMAVGFFFGCMWAVAPAVLADLFRFRAYASLYNLFIVANPIGSYLLSVMVVGRLFDREARREIGPGVGVGDSACHGAHCFGQALSILAACNLLAACLWGCLWDRTKNVYR